MLPIKKHLFCSCLVPGQGFGTGAQMRCPQGYQGQAALLSLCPGQGLGAHGEDGRCRSPQRQGWGCWGQARGPRWAALAGLFVWFSRRLHVSSN